MLWQDKIAVHRSFFYFVFLDSEEDKSEENVAASRSPKFGSRSQFLPNPKTPKQNPILSPNLCSFHHLLHLRFLSRLPQTVKSVPEPLKSAKGSLEETGWAPFNDPNGTHRLGELDLAFLTSYALGMYFAGHVGVTGKQLSHETDGILILTSSIAANLSTQDSIKGNSCALATVTAIIDGTGSVGAALGPLLVGYISTQGWNSVFLMLIVSIFLATLLLICIAKTEIQQKLSEGKWVWNSLT
ncbi:hypothetical protein QYF36_024289 [Acer negundo]|nr:hypothetical protein QYF36_024289 [Acer negundo]